MIALIIEAAARSVALGLVIWMALALLRPRNPHLEKTIWITAVLGSLAMPFLIQWNIAPAIQTPQYLLPLRAVNAPIANTITSWASVVTVLYWLVACGLVIRFTMGLARMWCIRQGARILPAAGSQADDVRVSPKIFSPATFGPTILLPVEFTQWSTSKLAAVISHERSHVRQKDCYVLWLAHLHACLFWINPFAWWIQRRLAVLAETTSDDAAVAELGNRSAYAEVLLEIASARPALRVTVAAARSNVPARIERIISEIAPVPPPKRRHQAMSVALLLPIVMMAAVSVNTCHLAYARADRAPREANAPVGIGGATADILPTRLLFSSARLDVVHSPSARRSASDGIREILSTSDPVGNAAGSPIKSKQQPEVGLDAESCPHIRPFQSRDASARIPPTPNSP